MRRFILKSRVAIGVLIAILAIISITTSIMLYQSIQEQDRLEEAILGYQSKIAAVEERNVRIVGYTNHLLMTVGSLQQEGN
jgi:ABC-type enterochelin transport system permease subunit